MKCYVCAATVVLSLVLPMTASAQLFMDDFDVDPSANWTLNLDGRGTDAAADFFFDYSSVGIPSAPNSTGGSTRGMKLQANLSSNIFGGMSVSPTGESFTGDYKLTFDLWGNYVGDPTTGMDPGGLGQTNLSTYGILTSGTTTAAPGLATGLWFAATVDGGSGADFRAYSIERSVSYQIPPTAPEDDHATYLAGSRNNTATLYSDNFGGATPPAAQTALYPSSQFGTTPLGSIGMEWHQVEIEKAGDIVTWSMDGVDLIIVDTANFTTPPDGTNILFGHSDINSGSSAEPDRFDLQFTLIDNVKVEAISVPTNNADFNGNGIIDAADYVLWRKYDGLTSGATQSQGDADGDGDVDSDDYDAWFATFGNSVPGGGSGLGAGAVPEPGTLAIALLGLIAVGAGQRRRT